MQQYQSLTPNIVFFKTRMRLPEGLNNFERSKVHELASLYGMNSQSYGSGKIFVLVMKLKP